MASPVEDAHSRTVPSRLLVTIDSPPELLAFGRGDLECWLNAGNSPVPLPNGQVLLGSDPGGEGGLLQPDAAVWVVTT